MLALLLSATPARSDPSNGLPTQFRPSFPVFGAGSIVNFTDGNNQAMTNAAAHVGFSLAIPLLGEHLWGRRGLWATGVSWVALSIVQESLFHAPARAGPEYPSEVRSDLITRILPCATLLVIDAIRGGGRLAASPAIPTATDRPGTPWRIGWSDEVRRATDLAALSGSIGAGAPEPQVDVANVLPSGGGLSSPAALGTAGGSPVPLGPACTESLLFRGDASCSWGPALPIGKRQLAAR